jgi:hypothetical protein
MKIINTKQLLIGAVALSGFGLLSTAQASDLTVSGSVGATHLNKHNDPNNTVFPQKAGTKVNGVLNLEYDKDKLSLYVTAVAGQKADVINNGSDVKITRAAAAYELNDKFMVSAGIVGNNAPSSLSNHKFFWGDKYDEAPFITTNALGELFPVYSTKVGVSYSPNQDRFLVSAGVTTHSTGYNWKSDSSTAPTIQGFYMIPAGNGEFLLDGEYVHKIKGIKGSANNANYLGLGVTYDNGSNWGVSYDFNQNKISDGSHDRTHSVEGRVELDKFTILGRYIFGDGNIGGQNLTDIKAWTAGVHFSPIDNLTGGIEYSETKAKVGGAANKGKAVALGMNYVFK